MFERRLKILLLLLSLTTAAMALRAAQIQGLQRTFWRQQARDMMTRPEFIETTRGVIRDYKGRAIALDAPCVDACVDYRAITEEPNADWLRQHAEQNLRERLGDAYGHSKRSRDWAQLLGDETAHIKAQLSVMWTALAQVSGKTPEEIDDVRRAIVQRVEMRRRYVWWRSYERAVDQLGKKDSNNWYRQFLGNEPSADTAVDDFSIDIDEQSQPHVILHAVDSDQQAALARKLDQYPGLCLQPSKHREYPFGRSACHVLGRLVAVGKENLGVNDPFDEDELRRYWPNDDIGQGGIEALCEKVLRGKRGRIDKVAGSTEIVSSVDPEPGKDVRLTIDIELESDIEQAFARHRTFVNPMTKEVDERENQHGAAVVIDVATGEVRALVSNPGFDPNMLDTDYPRLSRDDLNLPLMNRATEMALEPGSSVKTIVGSGAITHGFMTADSTVECTGYLFLRGHRIPSAPRCWIASQYADFLHGAVAHHPLPVPHPTGFLTISDGLERSCNVVFETIADKMGMHELTYWFTQFGLGRKTGIGIEESIGLIPDPVDPPDRSPQKLWTWYAGIGQGMVHATPIQMANVAATLARRGIWLRPHLISPQDQGRATTQPTAVPVPDRADLHLAPEAVDAVTQGMIRVTSTAAGTGLGITPAAQQPAMENDPLEGITIAGKTGSAQTGVLKIPQRDSNGEKMYEDGHVKRIPVELGTAGTTDWYIGVGTDNKHLAHAWFIGFAPAEHPQVAFCVMVEYGGAGGRVAGAIAHDVLEACLRHGYLSAAHAGDAPPVAGGTN